MNRHSSEDAVPSQETIENKRIDLLARVMTWLALATGLTLSWVVIVVMMLTGFIEVEAKSSVARLALGALAVLTILAYACLHQYAAKYFAFVGEIEHKGQNDL
jgi:hypothetical protein